MDVAKMIRMGANWSVLVTKNHRESRKKVRGWIILAMGYDRHTHDHNISMIPRPVDSARNIFLTP